MTYMQLPKQRTMLPYLLLMMVVVILAVILPGVLSGIAATKTAAAPLSAVDFGRLPLAFVPNGGQSDTAVRYQAHSPGVNLFFTNDGLTLAWTGGSESEAGGARLNFLGANSTPDVSGREAQLGVVNYMLGDNPDNWQRGLPTYRVVTYEALYPGISLAYSGQGRQLTAVFQVEAGADPAQIGWAFEWGRPVLDEAGGLKLIFDGQGAETAVTLSPPVAWQTVDGQDVAVTAAFSLDERGQVGLALESYDTERPLAILTNMNYGGTGSWDLAWAIAAGPTGIAYVVGETGAPIFPLANPYQPVYGGGSRDAFVTAFAPDGQSLVYSTFLGGSDTDAAFGIAIDNNDNAFVVGTTESTDFPLVNPLQNYGGGFSDTFVTALAPDGQSLNYSTYLGGSSGDGFVYNNGGGIVLDASGRAYVAGSTFSTDFPLFNPQQPVFGGGTDAFVTIIAPDGQSLEYSTYLGGINNEAVNDIARDGNGRIHIGGTTGSPDFPTANPLFPNLSGFDDGFVTVYAPDGQSFEYSTYLGGNNSDYIQGVGVDSNGQTYVTGYTWSTNFPLANPYQAVYGGLTEVFVTVFAQDGQSLVYSTYLGKGDYEQATSLVVDGSDRAHIVGRTWSSNFPMVNPLLTFGGGCCDAFVTVFAPDGQSLEFGTFLGGSFSESGMDIALDVNGRIYVTGYTVSDDFPVVNALDSTYGGSLDAFVSVIAQDGQSFDYSTYLHGSYPEPTSVEVSELGQTTESNQTLYLLGLGLLAVLILGFWLVNGRKVKNDQ